MRGTALGLALLLSTTDGAHARTPTPTYGPSPTITETGSPTPTGTPPTPLLMFSIAPNPARSGQRVTLDGSHNGPFQQSYQWSQIGGDVAVQLEDADQPIAHFTVPVLARPSVVRVQLAATGFNSGPTSADITLLPVNGVIAAVGSGAGAPGSTVSIDVTLRSLGLEVTEVEHDLGFGPYATVADRGGVPDCAVGPGLTATAASFVFTPDGCTTDATCSGVHAALTVRDPIPDQAVVYRCTIALLEQAAPQEEGCTHALTCVGGHGTSAGGEPLEVYCPDGSDGQVVADYADRPLAIEFQSDPAAPHVGDDVRATFTIRGDGGLPSYRLAGAAPYLSGPTSLGGAGPLSADVSFPLHADCPGIAPLQLSISYETLAGCPGNTYYRFTDMTSPVFPVVVSDPDLTPTPPPVTPTARPTGDLGVHEIQGRVYDLSVDLGAPLAGASVAYEVLGASADAGTVSTDSNGAFAFSVELHDTDRVYVTVGAPGFESVAMEWAAVDLVYNIPSLDVGLVPTNPVQVGWCPGDCNGDGVVTIGELVRGVNLALGVSSPTCPALDPNADGEVAVAALIAAIRAALVGCPPGPDTWEPIGPRGTVVHAIAVDPADSRTIYAGTPDGVRKTTDGGLNWTTTGAALRSRVLAIDPHERSTIFVGGDDGSGTPVIDESSDGGVSWRETDAGIDRALDFPTLILGLAIDSRQTTVLYAASSYKLYRRADGAAAWTEISYPGYQAITSFSFTAADPARVYLGLYREGVSIIDVDTNTARNAGGAEDLVCTLAAAPSDSDIAYADFPSAPAASKTIDGGATWSDLGGSLGCAPLVIDPVNPDVFYAAANPVFATSDGGATFHPVGRRLPGQLAVHAIVLDPAHPTTVLIGTDDGVYRLTGSQ